ncbi:MAG: AMP-binding protein, partial [Chloroflexota bacterium]
MILASDWIAFHADRTPEKLALIDQHTGRRLSYGDLDERAAKLAGYLREKWGVQPGDRIAILAKNSTEYFEFEFACIRLGALMLPLNWRLADPEILFILNDAEATGLVYDAEFADRIPLLRDNSTAKHLLRIDSAASGVNDGNAEYEAALSEATEWVMMNPQTSHDTPLTIMYTAGTTGHPKGVIITHGMMFWNAANITTPTGLNCESVFYGVLPTFHSGGLNLYTNPILHQGGTSIIARQYDPGLTLESLSDPALGV